MKNIYKCINGCEHDACEVVCYNNLVPPNKCIYGYKYTEPNFVLQKPDCPKLPRTAEVKKDLNLDLLMAQMDEIIFDLSRISSVSSQSIFESYQKKARACFKQHF